MRSNATDSAGPAVIQIGGFIDALSFATAWRDESCAFTAD